MDVNKFREFVLLVARKAQSGLNPTPSQFNLSMERAYVEWVMKRYGNLKEYVPGQPIPRIAWQSTQKISDDLRHLLERRDFFLSSDGRLNIPDGSTVTDSNSETAPAYLHVSSIRFKYSYQDENGNHTNRERPIDIIRDNEIGDMLSSHIVQPDKVFPKCAFFNSYVQFWPTDLLRVTFTYLRQPTVPVWGYNTVNGRPVYDATKSTNIDAPDDAHNEIAMNTLSYLGVSIREPELYQYAEQKSQQGV